MLNLFKDENYVASGEVRNLLSFAVLADRVTSLVALFDGELDVGVVLHQSLTTTLLARISGTSALTSTNRTLSLHLHLHSKAHLNVLHNMSLAIALLTSLQFSIFSSGTLTFVAVNISVNSYGPISTVVHIFQMNVHLNPRTWSPSNSAVTIFSKWWVIQNLNHAILTALQVYQHPLLRLDHMHFFFHHLKVPHTLY